jgi:Zn-dependent protease with chaperone function
MTAHQHATLTRLASIGLILLFFTGFVVFVTTVLRLGTHKTYPTLFLAEIILAWSLLSIFLARGRAPFILWHLHLRRLVTEERQQLEPLFRDLLDRLPAQKRYKLRIVEIADMDAFSILPGIVAISKPLVARLSPDELQAVLAHELGHVESGDCWVAGWMQIMAWPANSWYVVIQKVAYMLKRSTKGISIPLIIVLLAALILTAGWRDSAFAIGLTVAFQLLYKRFQRIFHFGFSYLRRQLEFAQDAFAESLGYGPALRSALLKVIDGQPQQVSIWSIFHQTHPIIYDRIRRLEKKEEQLLGIHA